MGIDGWKLDFGEEYIREVPIRTFAGAKTRQEYSEAYYRDFWEYGASKLGTDEFVTMVRPWDDPSPSAARPLDLLASCAPSPDGASTVGEWPSQDEMFPQL